MLLPGMKARGLVFGERPLTTVLRPLIHTGMDWHYLRWRSKHHDRRLPQDGRRHAGRPGAARPGLPDAGRGRVGPDSHRLSHGAAHRTAGQFLHRPRRRPLYAQLRRAQRRKPGQHGLQRRVGRAFSGDAADAALSGTLFRGHAHGAAPRRGRAAAHLLFVARQPGQAARHRHRRLGRRSHDVRVPSLRRLLRPLRDQGDHLRAPTTWSFAAACSMPAGARWITSTSGCSRRNCCKNSASTTRSSTRCAPAPSAWPTPSPARWCTRRPALPSPRTSATPTLFDAEELDAIRQHIPWTRIIEDRRTVDPMGCRPSIDLLPWAVTNKDNLVLKPNDEYGGKGVLIGWETEQDAWSEAVQAALRRPLDRSVRGLPSPTRTSHRFLPDGRLDISRRLVDCDPFIFNGDIGRRLSGAAEQGDAAQRHCRRRLGDSCLCNRSQIASNGASMFHPSYNIGIEEEYQVVDPDTRELLGYITQSMARETHGRQRTRRLQGTLPNWWRPARFRWARRSASISTRRARSCWACATRCWNWPIRPVSRSSGGGTHPFTRWEGRDDTLVQYRQLAEDAQMIARRAAGLWAAHPHRRRGPRPGHRRDEHPALCAAPHLLPEHKRRLSGTVATPG
jgi:hypothetical protein